MSNHKRFLSLSKQLHGRLASVVIGLGCLLSLPCCSQTDTITELKSQTGWMVHANGPVIKAGDHRPKALWNDPSVLKENGEYVMYMTTSVKEPFQPPVLPFRAVSQDALSWRLEPNQPLLDPAGTPFVSLETPSVVRFKDKYYMFYTGIYPPGQVPPMGIGYAVSEDGIKWNIQKKPLLTATANFQDWNGYLVGEPGAVVHKGKIFLYFSAIGARAGGTPPQLQTIGLVTSGDGVNFDAPRKVLSQSKDYPAKAGYVGYSTPMAFTLEGKVHLVYDVARFQKGQNPEWQQVALRHALSVDGETGFAEAAQPMFVRADFSWTSGEIRSPAVLVDEDKVKLWFAGNVPVSELGPLIRRGIKGKEFGIGYATMGVKQFMDSAPKLSAE